MHRQHHCPWSATTEHFARILCVNFDTAYHTPLANIATTDPSTIQHSNSVIIGTPETGESLQADLEDVLLRGQAKLLAGDGEGDIWQLRQLLTVHNSLAAAQE